jgi:hypothetical protein
VNSAKKMFEFITWTMGNHQMILRKKGVNKHIYILEKSFVHIDLPIKLSFRQDLFPSILDTALC